LFYCLII